MILCGFLLKARISLLTQDSEERSCLWGLEIIMMLVLVFKLVKLFRQLRPVYDLFLLASFEPPQTITVLLLVRATISLLASLVILSSPAPGIKVLDMKYSRPMRFLSSVASPLIWLSPISVIFFEGFTRVTLFTAFCFRVWSLLLCISGVRFSVLVSICAAWRLCRTLKRFEVWITGIGFLLLGILLGKDLGVPDFFVLVAVVFQLLVTSLPRGAVGSLSGCWFFIPFRSFCSSCIILFLHTQMEWSKFRTENCSRRRNWIRVRRWSWTSKISNIEPDETSIHWKKIVF